MVAGLLGFLDIIDHGLLIGLGGGGLVNFIHHVFPTCGLTVVELDPEVVNIAKQHFGLNKPSVAASVSFKVADGLEIEVESGSDTESPNSFVAGSLSFILIDVDAKDTSVGMSCPPISFIETNYLQKLKKLLSSSGVLAINVSARDPKMLDVACTRVGEVFTKVYLSKQNSDEDVNVVILATENDKVPRANPECQRVDEEMNNELHLLVQGLTEWSPSTPAGRQGNTKNKKKKSKGKGSKKR